MQIKVSFGELDTLIAALSALAGETDLRVTSDSGSGSQSEDAPAAEAVGPQSGTAKPGIAQPEPQP